jgi:hypothetical protein
MARSELSRRDFVGTAMALGALHTAGCASLSSGSGIADTGELPARGNYLIRNAYVLTMDDRLGDIEDGDIHIRDGEILALGKDIQVPGVESIDGSGMIALPGLIETHWHLWTSLLRGMTGDEADQGYFPMSRGIGQSYTAADMYVSTRFAAARRFTRGSPLFTTGVTTSATPITLRPISGRLRTVGFALGSLTASRRRKRMTCPLTLPIWHDYSRTGIVLPMRDY